MSKEKNLNLTFIPERTSSPAIDGTTHTSGKHYRHGRLMAYHIFGPAIDRLHEFEKLGLEPEEIENLKKEFKNLKGVRQANLILGEMNNDLHRENKELREEIERLQKADPNPILAKERELVGAKCLGLERENARLTQANSRLFVKKMDLEGKVWELNQIIKTLEDKLERIDSVLTEDDE